MKQVANNIPKIQHYVPQFILKNFTINSTSQIYVFDKKEERVFQTHIKNVAAENGFYNFKDGNDTFSIEYKLGRLEASTAKIIDKIIKLESISQITKEEKSVLSIFIIAQFLRTKQERLTIKQMDELMIDHITKLGGDPKNIKGFSPFSSEDEINKFAIITLEDNIKNFSPLIYNRGWILFKSTESLQYYISDNPITLHNQNDYGIMGNLGLGVTGIEIYFPLSPNLSIGIFDEHNQEIIRASYKKTRNLKPPETTKTQKRLIKDTMRGLETGHVVQSVNENVEFHNSMQIAFSSRFIYSANQNFDLVFQVLKANPDMKNPPQYVVNASK